MEDEGITTLRGTNPHSGENWEMQVVTDPPLCTLCETRNHEQVAFVLHSGAPVCAQCVKEFGA